MKNIVLILLSIFILIFVFVTLDQSIVIRRYDREIRAYETEIEVLEDRLSSYEYLNDRMNGIDSYAKWREHAKNPATIRRIEALREIEIK